MRRGSSRIDRTPVDVEPAVRRHETFAAALCDYDRFGGDGARGAPGAQGNRA